MNTVFFITKVLAADSGGGGGGPADTNGTPLGTLGGGGLGPFGNLGTSLGGGVSGGTAALAKVTGAISSIIGIMTVAAAIWFLFQLVLAGIAWITSGGDKTKLGEARDRITNAFIGLIIVVAGWAILALAGVFFGYDIIVSKPGDIINLLQLH